MGASGNPAKRSAADRAKAEARRKKVEAQAEDMAPAAKIKLVGRKGTRTIEVPAMLDWGDDAVAHLNGLNFRDWAGSALDEDNFEKWVEVEPTNRQAMAFVNDYQVASGEDLGESDTSEES